MFHPDLAERQKWGRRHFLRAGHSNVELDALNTSNLWLSPEAAYKLAPYGIFSPTDASYSEEHAEAMKESPRAPL